MAGDEAATDPPVQEDPTESTPAVADGSDDPSIDDGPKIEREPKPLKDVAEDIKRRMVMQDARTGRDKAVDSAEREIRKFQMLYDRWENDLEGNKDETEEPARPNYQEVADKYGIQFAETDWVDQTTIGDEQIGQVVVFDMASRQAIQIGEQLFFDFDNLRNTSHCPLMTSVPVRDFCTGSLRKRKRRFRRSTKRENRCLNTGSETKLLIWR